MLWLCPWGRKEGFPDHNAATCQLFRGRTPVDAPHRSIQLRPSQGTVPAKVGQQVGLGVGIGGIFRDVGSEANFEVGMADHTRRKHQLQALVQRRHILVAHPAGQRDLFPCENRLRINQRLNRARLWDGRSIAQTHHNSVQPTAPERNHNQ